MIIKEHINVKDDRLIDGLTPVVRMMSQMEGVADQEVTIDFSFTRFISPVFALSLIVYLSRCEKQISYKNVPDYLKRIGIDNGGIKPDTMRQTEFLAELEKYASKTYIPIIDFAAGRNTHRLTTLITLNNMKKIDIAAILSPDLKSRMRAQDLKELVKNSGADTVEMDFKGVKFATRSFIDEFYNLFLKTPEANSFGVELTNAPVDIKAMLDSVSRTQVRANEIPSQSQEMSFKDVKEFLNYFSTVVL